MSLRQQFELVSRLGEGKYSKVYMVTRKTDNKTYALKQVRMPNLTEKGNFIESLKITFVRKTQCLK